MKKIKSISLLVLVLTLAFVIQVSAQYYIANAGDLSSASTQTAHEESMSTQSSSDTEVGTGEGESESIPSEEFSITNTITNYSMNSSNQSLQVSFLSPTESNGAVLNRNYILVRAQALPRANVKYLYIYLYRENRYKWVRIHANQLAVRFINLQEGEYSFKAVAVDKFGRNVSTSLRRITIANVSGSGHGGNNTMKCNVTQLQPRCDGGTITSDQYEDGCRTIMCSSGSERVKALACDRSSSSNTSPRYFEMFAAQATSRDLRICLAGICINQDNTFVRSPRYNSRCSL